MRETFRHIKKLFICACLVLCAGFAMPNMGNAFAGQCTIPSSSNGSSATTGGMFTVTYYTSNPGGTVSLGGGTGCSTTEYYRATHSYASGTTWWWPSCKTCPSGYTRTLMTSTTMQSSFGCEYAYYTCASASTCAANQYWNGSKCTSCPSGYPYSAGGNMNGITTCYSATKSRAVTCTQNTCSKPSGCASVQCASSCSCSGSACDYVAYSNSAGTGDGTIKSGCSSNAKSCTKAVSSVTASAGYYVSNTIYCSPCTDAGTGYTSDGGSIGKAKCYRNVTRSCTQNNGSTPTGCASVTAWNACSCAGGTYKSYFDGSTSGTTSETCTKTAKTVTAKADYYVNGATCPTCSSYSSTYTKSDGGSISSSSCYTNVKRGCTQNNGSTPSGCASVTAWNACSCAGGTYKKYASGSTSGTTTNETCTKTPKTVTAASGYFVSNATCPACTTYSSSYPLSDGGSISATSCYTNVKRGCTQNNGSTPSGCASVSAWNACSCAGGTYKKYAGGGTSGTTTNETCTKTPKTVTASSNYYVSGTTCPSCSSKSSSYPYSAGGSIDYNSCYTNVKRGCTQNNGSTPSGCYQVVSWNSCSCAGNTYKKYYNGTTSGTTSNESCTKTPATVAANQNHYVSGTTCPACSSKSSTYTLSNGGAIDYNSCYTNITRSCSRSNGSTPSGCASVTAWNTCSCAGGTYKKFYNGTTSGTTTAETCTNTPKTVTASSNYYVSGTTCPSCSSKSSSYPYSAGGSIDYNSCYTNVKRGCTQNNGSTPSGCSGVSAWNACSCAGGTYIRYYNGTTSGTTSNETCTKTVKTVSGANANYYVNGTTCPSCSSKSSSYPYSAGGSIDYNSCYTNVTRSCQQNNGEVPSGCAAVSAWNSCSCAGNTYKKFYNGTTSGTTVESCTKTVKTPVASPNYYVNGTTCPSCSSKNSSYPSSDGGTIDYNSCYVTRTNTGYEVVPSLPTGCAAQTVNSCTKPTCSYKDYLGQSGETCSPGTCNQTHKTCTSTISNYYLKDGKPEACPTGYPYSAAGATAITSCYSGSKSRAWTGKQLDGNTPDGCYMVTGWNNCSVDACSYVAYSNSTGNGDGTIKSGCSSNSANCTKTIKSVTANQNHYVSGTTCPSCSSKNSSYPSSDGGTIDYNSCYVTKTNTGYEVAPSLPTGCAAQTVNSCTKPTCSYKDYLGQSGETCSPGTCNQTHKTCTSTISNYYLKDGKPEACPTGYPYSAAGATAITSCYSGSKSRAWTGKQLDGPTPDGCFQVVSWNSCSINSCSYTAYSNSTGNGDGTIKSGCSSNSANCTKTPKIVGANPGYYVDGVTCPACSSKFPDYTESHGGALDYNWCYKTVKRGCVQKDCSAPSGCATVTCASSCTCEGGSYLLYSDGNTAGVTEDETCTKDISSVAAATNNYVSGKSCLSCSTKNADYPNSKGGTGGHTICFSNSKWRNWNGKEEEEELPSGCANGTWGSCSHPRCEYVAYLNEAGTGDGIIKSGCEKNDEVCTKGLETLQAKSGHYVDGNTCPSCSDKNSGYPYSDGGAISYTSCYSGTQKRAWSGSQTPCEKPDNSASYSCDTCAGTACDYVAYLNSAANGDGTIKSGCSTNTTACQQNVKSGSVTCDTGFYTKGVTCPACTNKPDNSAYTGTATSNACPWECDTGYGQTSANLCAQMCTAGFQHLKSSTGLSIPLYTSAQTTHSIVVQSQSGAMCYASLASGAASGAINVNLDGTTYHTIK